MILWLILSNTSSSQCNTQLLGVSNASLLLMDSISLVSQLIDFSDGCDGHLRHSARNFNYFHSTTRNYNLSIHRLHNLSFIWYLSSVDAIPPALTKLQFITKDKTKLTITINTQIKTVLNHIRRPWVRWHRATCSPPPRNTFPAHPSTRNGPSSPARSCHSRPSSANESSGTCSRRSCHWSRTRRRTPGLYHDCRLLNWQIRIYKLIKNICTFYRVRHKILSPFKMIVDPHPG